MNKKRLPEIECPMCGKILRIRKGKPRTLKQWKVSLANHLIASRRHHLALAPKQVEPVIDKYFKSLAIG